MRDIPADYVDALAAARAVHREEAPMDREETPDSESLDDRGLDAQRQIIAELRKGRGPKTFKEIPQSYRRARAAFARMYPRQTPAEYKDVQVARFDGISGYRPGEDPLGRDYQPRRKRVSPSPVTPLDSPITPDYYPSSDYNPESPAVPQAKKRPSRRKAAQKAMERIAEMPKVDKARKAAIEAGDKWPKGSKYAQRKKTDDFEEKTRYPPAPTEAAKRPLPPDGPDELSDVEVGDIMPKEKPPAKAPSPPPPRQGTPEPTGPDTGDEATAPPTPVIAPSRPPPLSKG